ncbi:putative inactive disease susceptibility protein LOV1 [Coffea eugenioides]|uniref:putative inactive disease susceptibility protein LOV1 n=1 Tax=Coffea eugenioides TaxID=49369 RepID=UPI000F609122|nr:putative inactive disease susceptibility protein LOV1 [Coffea eugenioides]
MTAVASISAAVRRLQELLLDEARPLGQLEPEVKSTVLPRLQESEEMLMGLPAHKIRVKGAQDDLEFGRTTRSLLSSIEDKVESYALQLGSATSSSREACCGGGGGENTAFGKLVADLKVSVDGLKDCVTSYCAQQNQYQQNRKLGQRSQWLVSRANFSSGRWGDEAFGLEEEVLELTKVLVSEETDPRVVFIVGMGGIGKTTLAKKLFNHPDVRHHFKGFAWVYVGGHWSTGDILITILDQLSSLPRKKRESMMKSEELELAPQVFTILQRKGCLVVLDDCSDRELLDILSIAFPFAVRSASASKFILTTRNRNLSRFLDPGAVYSLRMESLNEKKSWDLLSHIWRKLEEGPFPGKLVPIAWEILARCEGLPLAIIVLASMLRTEREGERVLHNLLQSRRQMDGFPIGFHCLLSAYYALPLRLKACFLYLGNFPNNSRIQVEKLCQLWIAEGLISAEDGASEETMMDVAAKYFGELVARSLVTLEEDEVSDLRLMSGHIHGLIRSLCITEGREDEFFEIMPGSEPYMISKAQRCAIYFDKYYSVSNVTPSANLRSLLCLNSEQSGQGSRWPQGLFDFRKLRPLRVLDFDRVSFQDGNLPQGVGNLVFLRYLSFRGCYLEDLPSYIGNLLYLQTLDLRVQKDCIMTISNVIWKLERLRHLYFPLAFQTPDHGGMLKLDSLRQLEILEGLDTSVCRAKDLIKLTNLRILAATAEGNLEDLELIIRYIGINSSHLKRTSLDIKKFDCYSEERLSFIKRLFSCPLLDTLQIEGHIGKMSDIGKGNMLDIGTISPSFTKIVLNGSELDQDPMPTLENLPNLRILVLEVEAYAGKKLHCSDTGFPELRSLKLSKLYNLEEWEVDIGALQKLSTLEVSMCRRMKKLPDGLQSIITLRKLKVSMMPQQFLGRLRMKNGRGGEDRHKINSKCSIEFGNDDPWLESTISACQQNNSFDGRITESQTSSSTHSPNLTGSFACLPETERERDVYLQ